MMLARDRRSTVAAVVLSAALVALAVLGLSRAGFSATTGSTGGWSAGTVVLTDDDAGAALFDSAATGLLDGGQSLSRCITVTYSGTLTTGVAIKAYGSASGALAPYLNLTLEEGTGGGAGSCTGFTATRTVYTGTLASYAATASAYSSGVGLWYPAGTPATKVYKVTTTVQNVPAAQGVSATGRFVWEAQSGQPFDPTTLPGKAEWFRAKDVTGTNGDTVTTWFDQSGGQHNATGLGTTLPTLATGSTPKGGKSVRFNNAGYFDLGYTGLPKVGVTPVAAAAAVDGKASTNWVAALPTNLVLTLRKPWAETSYTITPYSCCSSTSPRTWTFEGSMNGSTWTILDTQTNVAGFTTPKTMTFANTTAYAQYRLYITAANGSGPYLAEVTLNTYPETDTAGEMWVVLKFDTTGSGGTWRFGTSAGSNRLVFGSLYEDFGSASLQTAALASPTSWMLLRVANDGTTWQTWQNGTLKTSVGALPTAWIQGGWLGRSASGYLTGNIAEVLTRNRVSTPDEVAQLTQYFNAEHGLTALAP